MLKSSACHQRYPIARIATLAALVLAAATLAVAMAAFPLTADAQTSGADKPAASGQLVSFRAAIIRTVETTPFFYAKEKGYYKDVGLDVTLSTTDSGPAIVTGVINGTFDVAETSAMPILIAISRGAQLRVMPGTTTIAPGYGESGIVVKAGSPISSYKDLVGKRVSVNALTSLLKLATEIGVKQHGGDPHAVTFVALPFKAGLQAVYRDQVDAAVLLPPFTTEGKATGFKIIADPLGSLMPLGAPNGIMSTNAENAVQKPAQITAFVEATQRAVRELHADAALQRKLAVTMIGMTQQVADDIHLPNYNTDPIDRVAFQKFADDLAEFGYTPKPVDVSKVIFSP